MYIHIEKDKDWTRGRKPIQWRDLRSFVLGFKSRQEKRSTWCMSAAFGCGMLSPVLGCSETSQATSTSNIFHHIPPWQLWCYSSVARVVPLPTDSDHGSSHRPICGPSTPCSWSASPELLAVPALQKLVSSFRTSKSQVKYYQVIIIWSCGWELLVAPSC